MKEEYRLKGVWLAADTVEGVFTIDPIDFPDMEAMRPRDFYSSLKDCEDGETIFAFFDGNDEEIFDKIHADYGIDGKRA